MNLFKKILFISILLGFFPISCGKVDYPYYQIESIQLRLFQDEELTTQLLPTDSLTKDTAFIKVTFSAKTIAQNHSFDLFNSQLKATTKPYDGYKGLKHKLSAIEIRSTSNYNGRQPSSLLNDLIIFSYGGSRMTIEKHLQDLNNEKIGYADGLEPAKYSHKFIISKPNDSFVHNFSFDYIFVDGRKVSSNISVNWK